MKKKSAVLFLIMFLVLSGCCPCDCAESTAEAVILPTTSIPASTSTFTAIPTRTIEPTNTIEPTIAFTSTPIRVPVGTFSPQEARDRIIDLLTFNGDCRLPCFWGIAPGQSSYIRAVDTFSQFNRISEMRYSNPVEGSWTTILNLSITKIVLMNINYQASENQVSSLGFDAYPYTKEADGDILDYESTDYGDLLNYYMLSSIMAEYGPPDEIYLTPVLLEGTTDYENGEFYLLLLYAEQGFAVHYRTRLQVRADQLLGCMNNAPVELVLLAPGNSEAFYANLPTEWKTRMEQYRPIDVVPGMTLESFYESFRNPSDQCIESPIDFWYGEDT